MKTLLITALLLSSALLAGRGNMMPSYSDFDTNADGKVTQSEFENTQQKRMIAKAEAGKMMRNAGNAPQFSDVDTNNDGTISVEEFQTHQANHKANMGRGQGRNR
jgi:Ca2+-binding EF-hand superfamily protein